MSTSLAASEVRKKNVPRRMFGKKARKNKAIQSWRRAAQLIIPVAHTIGALKQASERKRRKSFNNPENIENFSDKDKTQRLEEQIKLHHLHLLMKAFQEHRPEDIVKQAGSAYFPAKVEKRTPGAMNLEEFKATVAQVLRTQEYEEYLEKLFTKLDTSLDGYVDWNEFCTYMLLLYRENDYMRTKREIPFLVEPKLRHIVHNRQEQTTKIVASTGTVRYITISKEGIVNVWQPSLNYVEKYYSITNDESDTSGQKRRFKTWVTDAIFLPNCNKLVIGSTSRDIRFYDCSTNQHFEEFQLFAMSDVPYCFDYWYDVKNPGNPSKLIFGVDTGYIHTITFKKPVSQLFETPFKNDEGVQKIFWSEIEKGQQSQFVAHEKISHGDPSLQVLPDIVKQVMYLPDNDYIISSTSSALQSLVISPADRKDFKRSYVFNIDKGIESFDHNKNLNILVTGSLDHVVRIWNPYVTAKPMAVLQGHATGVIGVKIHEGLVQVFSYSKDAVIKVWDIKEHSCLQTVVLKFPSSIHGRMPEHGTFPIHMQPAPHNAVLVTCNDYLGMLKLGHTSQPKNLDAVTHDSQLCGAIYNKTFKQVVTGCDSSNIAVWELESGNKAIVFSNAHGDEEITCMAFDDSYRRLLTGARNGTIKVWNFQNGHNLHKLESVSEAEVTGIFPSVDRKIIIAVGWSRKIAQYDDSDPDNMYIPANLRWKGGQIHQDDILSMDFSPPNYLATGGYDGEIAVWDTETEKMFIRLRKGQQADILKKIEAMKEMSILSKNSIATATESQMSADDHPLSPTKIPRPNSRHRKSHRVPRGQPSPVDKLLFLPSRITSKTSDAAMLISSEAGYLHWWALFGAKHEVGYFYAPDTPDESVLGLCADPSNDALYTGDTTGAIKVWNISGYCRHAEDKRIKTSPELIGSWRAHDSSIVSLEYIEHEDGNYIVSASTDHTARLWSTEGHYVGTFGQKKSWNLKNKSTWIHPKTPWSTKSVSSSDSKKNRKHSKTDSISSVKTLTNSEVEKEDQAAPVSNGISRENTEQGEMERPSRERARRLQDGEVDGEREDTVDSDFSLGIRSQAFAAGPPKMERSQTFLGTRVAQQLQTIKESRIDRRNRLSKDVNFKDIHKFGKICSPYRALNTKDVEEIKIPTILPMSQRMLNKGYNPENMNTDTLKSMDLSYGSPDTPPTGEQTGERSKDKIPIKSQTAAGHRKPVRLAPLKKTNTVM
ncbi:WD repeat-containing protein on Y chromosome-like isoform X3 [Ostrea edulis]|uniref:WD repeat-containing protein on Y chromosome-like isoform X3 n=1 Tax=Ostrea edulis TaxID=37623 RepID=UPI0024AF4F55|nr:WD repeat-containing protein on Y chromosome-like isoform X3 [Ostrea edulis]XP_056019230.1 WD repeat-containing protein on Y chromosome-like isoform X3 [Ostrea edulis]